MKHAVARYVLRGKASAALVACGFGILALMLPPLSWPAAYFSGAALALTLLVKGPTEGIQTALVAVVMMLLLTGLAAGAPMFGLLFAILLWIPSLLAAEMLRQQRSLSLALTGVLTLGVLLLIGAYITLDNPTQWWAEHIRQEVIPLLEKAGVQGPQLQLNDAFVNTVASLMTGTLVASWVFGISVTLLLARWWQSLVSKPGAFAAEFYQLRFGTLVAGLVLVLVAVASLLSGQVAEIAVNLLLVAIAVFLLQGLAVMHQHLARQKNAVVWITVMYILMVLTMPYLLVITAALGWLDNWFKLRGRGSSTGTAA